MNSIKFCLLICLISFFTYSQDKKELTNEQFLSYKEKIQHSFASNKDSVIIYADIIENSSNFSHKAYAKAIKAYLYSLSNDLEKGKKLYNAAIEDLGKINSSSEKKLFESIILNFGGLIDWKNKEYYNSLKKYDLAKKRAQELGDIKQTIKINKNISLVNCELRKFKEAISTSNQSSKLILKNQNLYSDNDFMIEMSNCYLNTGGFYINYYESEPKQTYLLDSAFNFYNKSIIYSKNLNDNKLNAEINLATIYHLKGDLIKAEKAYKNILVFAKENDKPIEYFNTLYNLGDLCYYKKDYQKSLIYFKKVDSIYAIKKTNPSEYIKSNYYQAKIYNILKSPSEAQLHSQIYLDNFEKNEFKINNEIVKVNEFLSNEDVKKEMEKINRESNAKNWYRKITYLLIFIIFSALIISLFYNRKSKKEAEKKVLALLEEYKSKANSNENNLIILEENDAIVKNPFVSNSNNISEEKEKYILEKLKELEEKKYFLKLDFSQQLVAKKIKTNSTYISIVVNKYHNKTFSEYTNELRINYAIKEIITNSTYRKYSTQAIAESVGFKNNVSFTKSFNKRTGLTPAQFIKGIEKNEISSN